MATGIAPVALVSTASSVEIAEDGAGWFSPTVSLALRAGRSGSQETLSGAFTVAWTAFEIASCPLRARLVADLAVRLCAIVEVGQMSLAIDTSSGLPSGRRLHPRAFRRRAPISVGHTSPCARGRSQGADRRVARPGARLRVDQAAQRGALPRAGGRPRGRGAPARACSGVSVPPADRKWSRRAKQWPCASTYWQMKPVHTPLVQSALMRHACPRGQGEHDPPQSIAVSLPFWIPSVQVGALQVCVLRAHEPLRQSLPTVQPTPAAQSKLSPPASRSAADRISCQRPRLHS